MGHTYDAGFDACRPPDSVCTLDGEWRMFEKAWRWREGDTWECECDKTWTTDGWTWTENDE